MKATLINYNYDPTWLSDYPEIEPIIYDRSDDNEPRDLTKYGPVYRTPNAGDADYDKLTYLVENYHNLPDAFLWGKTNLPKYVDMGKLKEQLQNPVFTPLLKDDHRTYSDSYGPVCYYQGGIYHERADSWFFNAPGVDKKHFQNWQEWCAHFRINSPRYIPFPPGGNFILTREAVHKYSKDFYDEMRSFMPYAQRPVEAQCAERSYFLLWR